MTRDIIKSGKNSRPQEKIQPDYACVLHAGGRSSRMGGRSKADLSFEDTTIGRHIEDEMEKTGALCFYSYREETCRIPEGWIPVKDEYIPDGSAVPESAGREVEGPAALGPIAGICRTLEEAEKRGLCGVYVSPCDLPYFRHQMIPMVQADARAGGYDAVLWETRDGRRHYTCGFYSTRCLPAIRKMLEGGDLRLRNLASRVKTGFLSTEKAGIPDLYLTNVNTMEQYEKLISANKDPLVLCVCGWKDSGKTTLLLELVRRVTAAGIKAAVIKHDGHDFEADYPGTDSFRMKQAGAYGTAVFSEKKLEIVKEVKVSAGDLVSCFPEADLILIEGEKNSSYPKIETFRSDSERRLSADPATVLAYVRDWEGEDGMFPEGIPVLQNTDGSRICELVLRQLDQHVL